jgi:carboxylesterase
MIYRDKFFKLNNALIEEYNSLDPNQTVTAEKKAFWIEGDPNISKALFLAHGYMGSPGEMMYLAEPFIKAGWTVIGFLIPGHGSTYEISNQFKNERWIREIKIQLELATSCFEEVRAVGFSTGGLLLHHYALTETLPTSLKSFHLVSPYFIQRFGTFFDRMLGFFVNGMSVDTAYFLSHFRDLKVMTMDRFNYHQKLPMGTAFQVKDLGIKVFNMQAKNKIKIPIQLFLSEGDWTVDTDSTKLVINRDYENVELVWYKGSEPHHLMVPSVSTVANEVRQLIFSSLLLK